MIKQGQQIFIKPEWQDKGDDQFIWLAMEDEVDGDEHSTIVIQPQGTGMTIAPTHRVQRHMITTEA